jgi:hypothetical protein
MKFALRDDDLNYFFNPKDIEKWYENIWDICPISMSAIPFVIGNWKENTPLLEELGPNSQREEIYSKIKKDTIIYKLGDNIELINFVRAKISEGKIHITMHGVEHRNGDKVLPNVKNNFSIGAEFFTDRDLTVKVKKAKKYLEDILCQTISVFTPPQNLLSYMGIKAIVNNDMSICGDLPSLRNLKNIKLIGSSNFLKYLYFRLKNKTNIYPFPLKNKELEFITHFRLQPGTNLKLLYKKFDEVHKFNGNFVLSTHSYAFEHKMKYTNQTMQFELEKFMNYCKNKESVSFVSLNKIFS